MVLKLHSRGYDKGAVDFCSEFIKNPNNRPIYVLGCNIYAESINKACNIDGFIDDFTQNKIFCNKPIVQTWNIPQNSLVVSSVIGRPITAKHVLNKIGVKHLDYFAFYRYSGLHLQAVTFWQNFQEDFNINYKKYDWLHDHFSDKESQTTLTKLLNFRLTANLKYMEGFSDRQDQQYFEPFLNLNTQGETFIDAGGFEGETSIEFIKHCKNFQEIHFFEPEEKNMNKAKQVLQQTGNVYYYPFGLSDTGETCLFCGDGSISSISDTGNIKINVDCMDELLPCNTTPTFIKMDIEGAEKKALAGAKKIIMRHHPRLAVCVYHKGNDLWRIPEQILSYYPDYKMFLRHYTEGVTETVMFFMDKLHRA